MRSLFEKIRHLRGDSAGQAKVRRVLSHYEREHRPLELELITDNDDLDSRPMDAAITHVGKNEIIVTIDHPARPFPIGAELAMSFHRANGTYSGETIVRSRCVSKENPAGFLYRLALPKHLERLNLRRHFRVDMDHADPVAVTLRPVDRETPVYYGELCELSLGGASVLMHKKMRTVTGEQWRMCATLPQHWGEINEVVCVMRVQRCAQEDLSLLGLAFLREANHLERFIRHLDIQRASRTRRIDAA